MSYHALFMAALALSQPAAAPVEPAAVVSSANQVQVKGVLPGPGFWKVSNGQNTLWLLATVRPLPRNLEWETIKLERALAQSQLLLSGPGVTMDADIGFFGKIGLVPSLLKARKNPEGKTLKDVLPPATYQRWLVLKKKYIGNDASIESWRPIFVAQELYQKAIKKAGLENRSPVWPVAEKFAERRDIPIIRPRLTLKVSDPKGMIKTFTRKALNDTACFEKTLDSIEQDVQFMARRGQLWAYGQVAELQQITFNDFSGACIDALLDAGIASQLGQSDVQARIQELWLQTADKALASNRSTVAVLNMGDLLGPKGYLARLRAKGYQVEEPAVAP
jgi:hypothetical protein